jgi:2-dehydro-3-deoxyphosphogalactonate aldolase
MTAAGLLEWLAPLPLVPILRGVRPAEAVAIGRALLEAGFPVVEVPMNSPEPLASIRALAEALGDQVLVGAGTVLRTEDVAAVAAAGGRLIVMPHADLQVIAEAKRRALLALPGVATPTEAFAALAAGADGLKLFPAEMIGPAVVKSLRAVLPRDCLLLPVGGITPGTMEEFLRAGADGFGIGSAIYKPGETAAEVSAKARAFVEAWRDLHPGRVLD